MRAFRHVFNRIAAAAAVLLVATSSFVAADHESPAAPAEAPSPLTFPRAADVTAVATYALTVDDDADVGSPGTHALVTALGTNSVPATVHFASHCGADTFYEGGSVLPTTVGPIRSAAAWEGDVAWGTAQTPGVVAFGGTLTPGHITLRPGENVLAAATAGPGPSFLFATWTAPSSVVKLVKDDATGQLVRADSITLPLGVDYVRAAAVRIDAGTGRRSSLFATDTSPAAVVEIRDSDLTLASAAVMRGGEFVRAGCVTPDGTASYWVTHTSPSKIVKLVHTGGTTSQVGEPFELDAKLGENLGASAVTDERGLLYVGFSSISNDDTSAVASVFEDVSTGNGEFRLERLDLTAVDDAYALMVSHAQSGVARYATRSDPARLVTIQHPGAMPDPTVTAQSGSTRVIERCEVPSTPGQIDEMMKRLPDGMSPAEASALIVLAGFMCALW